MENSINLVIQTYNNNDYKRTVELCDNYLKVEPNNYLLLGYKGLALAWGLSLDNVNLDQAVDYFIESLKYTPEEELSKNADYYLNELIALGKTIARTHGKVYQSNPNRDVAEAYLNNIKASAQAVADYLTGLGQEQMIKQCNLEIAKAAFEFISNAFGSKIGQDYNVNNHPSIDAFNLFFDRLDALFNLLDFISVIAEADFTLSKAIYESMIIVCEELLLAKAWGMDNNELVVIARMSSQNCNIVYEKLNKLLNLLYDLYKNNNSSNDKYFNVHNDILVIFNENIKLRAKAEETRKLVENCYDINLVNQANNQLKDVEKLLNEYDNQVNKLRYSLFE